MTVNDYDRLKRKYEAPPVEYQRRCQGGTLHQYAGRLHRYFRGKKDVRIYDYIDLHAKMLEKMYGKRLKGYVSIGYKTKNSRFPDAPTNLIFNKDDFFPVYLRDIAVASKDVIIISPFVTKQRMRQMVYKSNIHQKFAIIDNKITWYGSINLLSFGYSEETVMRLESSSIARELLESINIC